MFNLRALAALAAAGLVAAASVLAAPAVPPPAPSATAVPPAPAATAAPFGLDQRVPWTGSRVVGSPEPASPFVEARSYPALKFDHPVHAVIAPDGGRWFVVQETGQVLSFPAADDAAAKADPFLDCQARDPKTGKRAPSRRVWSIAFHPRFAENGYVYACFLEYKPAPLRSRIVRYTVDAASRRTTGGTPPTCSPDTETLVAEWPAGEDHFGGCLAFGTDGMLYFSAGDGHGYADGNVTGQRIDDLNASILRIDVDHPAPGQGYCVPADNPFVNTPGARPEVWAYGLRNVWKFSIDRPTGQLWGGDVGQDLWESVVLVARGGNYGWSVTEGTHAFREARPRGPTPILPPVFEHEHSESRSITGGFVYRGSRFPELAGQYVYGDYETGKVWALRYDGAKVTEHKELVDTPLKLVAFGQDAAGELLLLDYQGATYRLDRNPAFGKPDATAHFPRKLSETGLFASTKDHVVAPGVVPYDVNSPLWSDGAKKQRFIAVPGDGKIKYSPDGAWGFPDGSVLVKTFELELTAGDPASRRRLETRLMHVEQDHWRGYTYVWNDAQTDADLLDDPRGKDQTFAVRDPATPGAATGTGAIRQQVWHYPSRAECTLCHTMPAGFVLGPSTAQMNRTFDYAAAAHGSAPALAGGSADNQIRALEHVGLFDKPVPPRHKLPTTDAGDPAAYAKLPRMPDPADAHAPLDDRARAYLHANCSHCHRKSGGGNALFELQYGLPLDKTKTLDVPPQHGDHGVAGGKLLVPGDPAHTLLLWRMNQLGPERMPRAGSTVVDEAGAKLIAHWVAEMAVPAPAVP
ncbi:MAG: gdhB [Phycisphaerales bacterium]|nr:gdhB [Phycisphaerales bacterium]